MTIRVGFFGAGLISHLHTWFLHESDVEHEIVAVHDPDAERATAFVTAHGGTAVGEDELLDLVDAVYVTTWTSEHPRLVEKAAAAGVAVFCEKPLAVDAPTAARMHEVVSGAGVVNQVGLVLRSLPTFRWLRRLIEDERAGRVLAVVFRDDQYIPIQGMYESTWRKDPTKAGRGAILEHSIHDIDILQWMLGPIRAVSASTREVHGYPRIDDVAAVRMDFDRGAAATLASVWHDILERPSMRHVEVFSERLYASLENEFAGPVRWRFTGDEERSLDADGLVGALRDMGDPPINTATTFLTAVRDGTPADPDFGEALAAHQVVDAIYRSADTGGGLIESPDVFRR